MPETTRFRRPTPRPADDRRFPRIAARTVVVCARERPLSIDLAEFRSVAIRRASTRRADAHIDDRRAMGVTEYGIDSLWEPASGLKATQAPSLGDAYAVAVARELGDERATEVTLLVGPDDDYDAFEGTDAGYSIERFRDASV